MLIHSFGRLMQHVGLIVPPVIIILQLAGSIRPGQMLIALIASVCVFYIGRILEGYGRT